MARRALVIEDDSYLAELVCRSLSKERFEPVHVTEAAEARNLLDVPFDIVILDIGLPDASGIDLCRELRGACDPSTGVLIVSSRSSEIDKVLGLESGADDYITKPFGMAEMMARIRAVLRRVQHTTPSQAPALCVAGLQINESMRQVERHGQCLPLTSKEFDLLAHLAKNPGVVYKRSDLLSALWGHRRQRDEHAVSCHINRLRAKIESDPARPKIIETVWGVGYRLNCDVS